jgi:glucose-6-phosphate isomerase
LTESAPIDPTSTDAWKQLAVLAEDFAPDLRGWFAADASRAERFTFQAADLTVDLSKGLVTEEILGHLLQLANDAKVSARYDAMISGEHINVTEDRAVLHTALRRPEDGAGLVPPKGFVVDGEDVDSEVHATLDKVYAFADKVRSGEWTGVTGKRISTVVNIGIGGSDLGPVMVYEALKPYVQAGLECRFVSNIDPRDADQRAACPRMAVARAGCGRLAGRHRRGTQGCRCEALRRRVDRPRQGRGVRHRPAERVRILGLGRRPLLG